MTESTTDTETRGETEQERINRNWDELLQELRVTQTGVQILTGFLLTLPFQQRFALLDDTQQAVYLTTVGFAVLATGLLVAPVSHIAPSSASTKRNGWSRVDTARPDLGSSRSRSPSQAPSGWCSTSCWQTDGPATSPARVRWPSSSGSGGESQY
jgi:hypothetical protein